jgi:hypothetical protein
MLADTTQAQIGLLPRVPVAECLLMLLAIMRLEVYPSESHLFGCDCPGLLLLLLLLLVVVAALPSTRAAVLLLVELCSLLPDAFLLGACRPPSGCCLLLLLLLLLLLSGSWAIQQHHTRPSNRSRGSGVAGPGVDYQSKELGPEKCCGALCMSQPLDLSRAAPLAISVACAARRPTF